MNFLKKVSIYSATYFIVVLLFILGAGQKLDIWILALQGLFFGIITGGYSILQPFKSNAISPSLGLKNKEEQKD
jgi:hypothetical protein